MPYRLKRNQPMEKYLAQWRVETHAEHRELFDIEELDADGVAVVRLLLTGIDRQTAQGVIMLLEEVLDARSAGQSG